MSNLLRRLSLEMNFNTMSHRQLCKTYNLILHQEAKLYHFDDSPHEIFDGRTGERTFTDAEAIVIRKYTHRLHRYDNGKKLFSFALALCRLYERKERCSS